MIEIGGYTHGHQPGGVRPHLVLKLKSGWSFDSSRRLFIAAGGKSFSPKGSLPKRTQIVYMVPDLAKKSRKSLSVDERNLAQYLQIILPRGTDPANYLPEVKRWPCTAEGKLPAEISLPKI